MSLRTLKFGDRTISYDTGLNLADQEAKEEENARRGKKLFCLHFFFIKRQQKQSII